MFLGIGKRKEWRGTTALCFVMLMVGCDTLEQPKAEHTEVVYSVIEKEKITLTSTLPGRVSAVITAEVRPQVDGIIIERLFDEGADVVKGQVLYRIDSAAHRAAFAMAKASLAEAQANVKAIALLEARQRILLSQNAVSRQDMDNTISQHGQARARIAKAEAELESAAINLAYTEITASVAGRIGASSVTVGALVTANQSAALAVIHQTDRVYVDIRQPSTDTIRLRRAMAQGRMISNGNAAKVRLRLEDGSPYTALTQTQAAGEPEWIQGDLLFSEISVGKSTGSLTLRAVFNNPDGLLLPGMYVTAIIEGGTIDNAVLIPQGVTLANNTGGHSVFVLNAGDIKDRLFRVERRDVRLERAFGNHWIVSTGLSAGDILIVEGFQKAIPGELVKGTPMQAVHTEASAAALSKKGW